MPGLPELLVVLVIILLVFGPKRLPGLGRQLGSGMREFKDSITKKSDAPEEPEEAVDAAPVPARPELTRAQHVDPLADPSTPAAPVARDESATRSGG